MSPSTFTALIATILAVAVAASGVVAAAPAQKPRTKQIAVSYAAPKNPAHQPLHDLLRKARTLEKMQEILSPFRLPKTLTLKIEGCDGVSNAWYEEAVVTVCYEYLDEVWQKMPAETAPGSIAPIDAIVGQVYDVFFHEFGHAIFDLLQIPLFGKEEDAADTVSALLMLAIGKDHAYRVIAGAAYLYKDDLKKEQVVMTRKDFADVHSSPQQRFYSLLCIAYGSDTDKFADFVKKGFLPKERADECEDEYTQAAHAFNTLIRPHIDRPLAKQVLAKDWSPDVNRRPPHRPKTPNPGPK
jgi:hypothetical protein